MAPDQDEVALFDFARVHSGFAAKGVLAGRCGGSVADGAFEPGGANAIPQAAGRGHVLDHAEGAAEGIGQDCGAAVLIDDLLPAAGDFGDRVVPGDALPAVGAFGTGAAHGVLQAVSGIDAVEIGADLGAEPTLGDGVIGIGVEVDDPAVFDLGDERATVWAVVGASAADDQAFGGGHE